MPLPAAQTAGIYDRGNGMFMTVGALYFTQATARRAFESPIAIA